MNIWLKIVLLQLETQVSKTFKDLVQKYYGSTKDPLIDEAIDFVQKTVSELLILSVTRHQMYYLIKEICQCLDRMANE